MLSRFRCILVADNSTFSKQMPKVRKGNQANLKLVQMSEHKFNTHVVY